MTIEIEITNKDKRQSIVVAEVYRPTGAPSYQHVLKPGENRTFYVHIMQTLAVRELAEIQEVK